MSVAPRILVGAAPGEESGALSSALQQRGAEVDLVHTGVQVLETALFERFDGIVVDTSIDLIGPLQVRDLLKANPRTHSLPVVLLDTAGTAPDTDAPVFVTDPLSDESWLDTLLGRRGETHDRGAIEADLAERSVVDLIQMLLQNRRIGILELDAPKQRPTVELAAEQFGRIRIEGRVGGIKALARLIDWTQGQARFRPRKEVEPSGQASAQALLYDAIRLRDEWHAGRARLPPGSEVRLRPEAPQTPPPHDQPILEELLLLADFYARVDDLVERVQQPDAEVLNGLQALIAGGWLELRTPKRGNTQKARLEDLPVGDALTESIPEQVWLLGSEPEVAEVLWNDDRLKARLQIRRSLRNPGRFGGHGWFVEAAGKRHLWLRSARPNPAVMPFLLRDRRALHGVLFLLTDEDVSHWDQIQAIGEQLFSAQLPVLWLPVGADAQLAHLLAQAPGRVVAQSDDLVASVWAALAMMTAAAS